MYCGIRLSKKDTYTPAITATISIEYKSIASIINLPLSAAKLEELVLLLDTTAEKRSVENSLGYAAKSHRSLHNDYY
jgi:hypothetical protein